MLHLGNGAFSESDLRVKLLLYTALGEREQNHFGWKCSRRNSLVRENSVICKYNDNQQHK